MKKTLIISVIALSCVLTKFYATPAHQAETWFEVVKTKVPVNPFCLSIVKGDIETVRKLIDLGEDVNENSNGMTPAMYAAKYNRVAILELLVKNGADVKRKSAKGMRAMDYAKKSNAKDTISYLKNLS